MLEERFYNFSSASGFEYTVDISKPVGERVAFFTLRDSTKFSLDSTYTVAINSYRGNGGGGHWIKEKKKLYPRVIGNWYIKPRVWWKNGKEIDYKLLFGD
jgi:2',3'-cyclic-nucleotide 2'-phosphodiesterase/3'-nucleotidase